MSTQRTSARKTCSKNSSAAATFAALAAGLAATPALGIDRNWNVGTGQWGLSASWSPAAVPTASDIVYLNRLVGGQRGVVTVSGTGFASPISVSIRQSNELNIANFSALSVGGDVIVGYGDSFGIVNVNGPSPGVVVYNGQLTVGNTLRLGYESSLGVFNQNDGIVTVNQLVRVGDRHSTSPIFPGSGRYNLSGVGQLNAARLEVGYGGDASQYSCDGTFNLSGSGVLNISLGAQIPDPKIGGGGGTGVFNQTGGTVNSPFRILSIGGNTGPGTYNFSGGAFNGVGMSLGTTGTLNYTGGSNLSVGQLSTTNGKVNLGSGGGKILRATLLWTSPGQWTIDLNDNAMVVSSTLGDTVQTAITRGYNNGAWNGTGIKSSAAAASVGGIKKGEGVRRASDLGLTTYGGQPVSPTATIIEYTFMGDTNLDGVVNFIDFTTLANNFNQNGKVWTQGDFNYNGVVNGSDFSLLAANFNLAATGVDGQPTPQDWANLSAAVPEPLGCTWLCIAAATLTQRRRSRTRLA